MSQRRRVHLLVMILTPDVQTPPAVAGRGIIGRDSGGKGDPMIKVTVLDRSQNTVVKKDTVGDVTWDQTMFFEFESLKARDIETGTVLIEVKR